MSKNLTIQVSKEIHDFVEQRATMARLSKNQVASLIFDYGMKQIVADIRKAQDPYKLSNIWLNIKFKCIRLFNTMKRKIV